jgi:NAD(P)-dependent dehydrogenase (short-subunit alcohol dehydrogenase family)
VLAQTGAEVLLTGRNDAKGRDAVAKIRSRIPGAKISYETLDLASLASVTDFAKRFAAGHSSLDLLMNNAGASWRCRHGRPQSTVSKCNLEPTISVTTR